MTAFQFVLIGLGVYIVLYTLIDRVCKCVEHCAQCKGAAELLKDGSKK